MSRILAYVWAILVTVLGLWFGVKFYISYTHRDPVEMIWYSVLAALWLSWANREWKAIR